MDLGLIAAPLSGLTLSNLGRAALAGYLKALAAEVAADRVTVNLLLPGRLGTERVARLDAAAAERTGRSPSEVTDESHRSIPAGVGLDLNVPFGGDKNSSSNTFREQDTAVMDSCTWSKTVYLGHQ